RNCTAGFSGKDCQLSATDGLIVAVSCCGSAVLCTVVDGDILMGRVGQIDSKDIRCCTAIAFQFTNAQAVVIQRNSRFCIVIGDGTGGLDVGASESAVVDASQVNKECLVRFKSNISINKDRNCTAG